MSRAGSYREFQLSVRKSEPLGHVFGEHDRGQPPEHGHNTTT